jgi:hypothetical protein
VTKKRNAATDQERQQALPGMGGSGPAASPAVPEGPWPTVEDLIQDPARCSEVVKRRWAAVWEHGTAEERWDAAFHVKRAWSILKNRCPDDTELKRIVRQAKMAQSRRALADALADEKAAASGENSVERPALSSEKGMDIASFLLWEPAEGRPRWRIKGSGVKEAPETAPNTSAVVKALERVGLKTRNGFSGNPIMDVAAWSAECRFLDGGLDAETGNYFNSPRGAWVAGPRAALLVALLLGLRVTPSWLARFGLTHETLPSLLATVKEALAQPVERSSP